jgi:triosephosphate isomerase (TIM)
MKKNPIIIINYKTYSSSTAKNALKLTKAIESFSKNIIICPQATDLYMLSKNSNLTVYAQHIDPLTPGKNTGYITPDSIKQAGAKGTLINHSEHRLDVSKIKELISICKKLKLKTIVCAESARESAELSKLDPDYIAMEPPELIGGDISVSKSNPNLIKKTIELVKKLNSNTKILIGAGIKDKQDIEISVSLGADGVLLASGITCAKNTKKALGNLLGL